MFLEVQAEAAAYLAARDKRLGEAMRRIGPVRREVEPDLFAALVNSIVGQQISTAAQCTVWARFVAGLGAVTPARVAACTPEALQAFGISFRKAGYILAAAQRVQSGALDLAALAEMPDDAVVEALCALPGVGVWTAEMLLTFSMRRPDVVSFGDFGIRRGMRMLYRHRELDRTRFERYRRRYSPYGTAASLYLWAIAGGALPELTDPAAKGAK